MYKITIKGITPGMFSYVQVKEEIMEKIIVTDPDGNDTIDYVGTNTYKMVDFETDDIEIAKDKYIELLKIYREDELNLISDITEKVTYTVDVIQ